MTIDKITTLKILLVGSNATGSLENAYLRAFRNVGLHNVEIFDVDKHRVSVRRESISQRIIGRMLGPLSILNIRNRFRSFLSKRNYEAVIVFKGMEFPRETLDEYRRIHPSTLWININPDDPLNIKSCASSNLYVLDSLSFYDIYFIWSKKLLVKLRENGCRRAEYLPFGYDPDFQIPPHKPVSIKRGVISFVGAWDTQREAILNELADYDLRIYGSGWNRIRRKSPLRDKIFPQNIYGEELSEVVYSSEVCLNILRPQNYGAHNMRTFEIPAMGGVMLTTRSEEQHVFFPEGEASIMFDGIAELRRQLDRAIGNDDIIQRIRSRNEAVIKGHSYIDRAKYILGTI